MIRQFEQSDLDDVLQVWLQASTVAHPFLTTAFLDAEKARVRDVYMPAARTWVYEMEGQVVGFISMMGNEVGGLFVRPDRHKRGIGRALMDTVHELHPVLEVEVFKENAIGRAFYAKYGFQLFEESVHDETRHEVLRLRLVRGQ